jgi:hypothetical protein
MGDELDDLGQAWRSSDLGHAELLGKARRMHRRARWHYLATLTLLAIGFAMGLALLIIGFGELLVSRGSAPTGTFFTVAFVFTVATGWMMLTLRRQQARFDAATVATPLESVRFLLEYYRSRLYWWTGRIPLAVTAVMTMALAILMLAAWRNSVARGDEKGIRAVRLGIAFTVAWYIGVGLVAWLRVRALRRRVAGLGRLELDLAGDGSIPTAPAPSRPDRPSLLRIAVVVAISAGFVLAMTLLMVYTRQLAMRLMESGAELPLQTQLLIMTGSLWGKLGGIVTLGLALVVGAWILRGRRAAGDRQ